MGCKRARLQKSELPLSNFPSCLISFHSSGSVDIMLHDKTNGKDKNFSCRTARSAALYILFFSLSPQ